MQLMFEMGPEFKDVVNDLSEAGKAVRAAASEGLAEGVSYAADHVSEQFLSGQYLKVRTGNLRRAVDGWMASDLDGVVGVPADRPVQDYMYLLGDETKTIRPKRAKFLAIPIGENLTSAGVPRFDSPRDVPDGFFFRSKAGQLLFGHRKGKTSRARVRPLFVLKKEVTVHGTGALLDGVEESLDKITAAISKRLDKKLN
ncbi:MAG: hypothetical protein U9R68_07720 [Planctomycetota bacterium]|nr:hypothetical protein [Planctomycetota bacterium]